MGVAVVLGVVVGVAVVLGVAMGVVITSVSTDGGVSCF